MKTNFKREYESPEVNEIILNTSGALMTVSPTQAGFEDIDDDGDTFNW